MQCKIKVTNPSLAKVLGNDEFESFEAFKTAINPGEELLVHDPNGHFIATFQKFSFPGGKLKVHYRDSTGNGQSSIDEILGKATIELLQENSGNLDTLAQARILQLPQDVPPTNRQEQLEAIYDPSDSSIKFLQFESTTGQDVANDFEGALDGKPSTLAKMELKQKIADAPHLYRYFIVKDNADYFNEEGIEPTGEVLLVVYAEPVTSEQARLGRALTQGELKRYAVKVQGSDNIYTLPLESDRFFDRNHDERVAIYADKFDVSIEEADRHFIDGAKRMREARMRAANQPVEVRVNSVSQGSYAIGETVSIQQLARKNGLRPETIVFRVSTKKSEVTGRVYAEWNDGSRKFSMLTVPKSIRSMYGTQFIWDTYQEKSLEGLAFLESLFGTNTRQRGPYLKNNVLMFKGQEIRSFDELNTALDAGDWPMLTNKVRAGISTLYRNGEFITVPNGEFIESHVDADGNFWIHNGIPVPYTANRYLYLKIPDDTVGQRIVTPLHHQGRILGNLFLDPAEYDRISVSDDPRDVAYKLANPVFFTKQFKASESYVRLRKRGRVNIESSPLSTTTISYPVGGKYFGSKSVVTRRIPSLLQRYIDAGVPTPFQNIAEFNAYVNAQVEEATKQGIELGDVGTTFNQMFTHFANQAIADVERKILFGQLGAVGNYADGTLEYWNAQPATASASEYFTNQRRIPLPTLVHRKSDGPALMTIDAYRDITMAMGVWTSANETEYQSLVERLNEGNTSLTPFSSLPDVPLQKNTTMQKVQPHTFIPAKAPGKKGKYRKATGTGIGSLVHIVDTDELRPARTFVQVNPEQFVALSSHHLVVVKRTQTDDEVLQEVTENLEKSLKTHKAYKNLSDEEKAQLKARRLGLVQDGINGALIHPSSWDIATEFSFPDWQVVVPNNVFETSAIPVDQFLNELSSLTSHPELTDRAPVCKVSVNGHTVYIEAESMFSVVSALKANGASTITLSFNYKNPSATAVVVNSDNGNFGLDMPVFMEVEYKDGLASFEFNISINNEKAYAYIKELSQPSVGEKMFSELINGANNEEDKQYYADELQKAKRVREVKLNEFLSATNIPATEAASENAIREEKTVKVSYAGFETVKTEDGETVASAPVEFTVEFKVVGPDSEEGRRMLNEGVDIESPHLGTIATIPSFYIHSEDQAGNTKEVFLNSLETVTLKSIPESDIYEYAITHLGRNFAHRLFSTGQTFIRDDIDGFRADIGGDHSFTRYMAKKDFAVSNKSAGLIASGAKTITLRKSEADYLNKSGLLEIDGDVFDVQELGNLTFEQALGLTRMTQQEFVKAFMGEDVGVEAVFDEGVRDFLSGKGTRRVYTIRKLGDPLYPSKQKRKSTKKPIPC